MKKLMIDVRPDGTALVDGVLWGADTVRAAVSGAAICKHSRGSQDGCGCTCCQVAEAVHDKPLVSEEECLSVLRRVRPELYADVMAVVGKTRSIHSTVDGLQSALGKGKAKG
jgi:hypothetical protein